MASKTYYMSDFPNNKMNTAILTAEVEDSTISLTLESINLEEGEPHQVTFEFTGTFGAGDESALDAVVAAHQGDDFTTMPAKVTVEAESSDDSGSETVKASLPGVLPSPGTYLLMWYMEIGVTTTTGSTGVRGKLNVTKNGGSAIERAISHGGESQYSDMSGTFPFTAEAGDTYDFELTYERIGTSGNAAKAQRARIAVVRIGQ